VLGKLLKHIGDERVLWGTDSIWFARRRTRSSDADVRIAEQLQRRTLPGVTPKSSRHLRLKRGRALYGIEPTPGRFEPNRRKSTRFARRCRPRSTYGPETGTEPRA